MHGDIVDDVSYAQLAMRRPWGEEEELGIVLSVGVDRAAVTQVVQRHDVTRQRICVWRHALKKNGLLPACPEALFLPVELDGRAEPAVPAPVTIAEERRPSRIELPLAKGRCLRFDPALDATTLRAHDQLIQTLRLRIAKLKKQVFGQSSEKIEREIEQLELALEDLLIAASEGETAVMDHGQGNDALETTVAGEVADRPSRRRPRVKTSCRRCERMVQMPAPRRPIPGSMAGAGLLAHVLVSKFDDHLPLFRQHEIFARMRADIPDSTLVDWCGRAMKVLAPLIERIEADVMASDLLHADDTPIRVLDRASRGIRDKGGLGKGVKKGRIRAYVRDPRPWAGTSPPGAVYAFAPDRKEEHVHRHPAHTRGILQADGYKGYAKLYGPDPDGTPRLQEAACWAHLRRDFHDEWDKTKSAIAREVLDRIGALYDVEREITGRPADIRLAARQRHSAPKVEAFFAWSESQLARIPGKGDLAKAFRYGLSRQAAFSLFLEDGRVAIDIEPWSAIGPRLVRGPWRGPPNVRRCARFSAMETGNGTGSRRVGN